MDLATGYEGPPLVLPLFLTTTAAAAAAPKQQVVD